ncbi:MAG: FGGY family carbohydrate kinase [Bacteroidota bacterium]|nr:FGGY family carbohydrate kinase [Bacteroidota bacterium]
MTQEVIAIFDIGKTNKKILLFNQQLKRIFQEEQKFGETSDEDGFPCDDIEKIEDWIRTMIHQITGNQEFDLKAVNIATYGASLVYLDSKGQRLTPVYNYLKPMPEDVLTGFYERYGGTEEFSRNTASPVLGMLNSGMQILWLKKYKPEVFAKVHTILHFPQYLSYLISHEIRSEYTSIGCHTAMWDFDHKCYHKWLSDEEIALPFPVSNEETTEIKRNEQNFLAGTGIHDSSSSLVPYLKGSSDPFILISTGTWCIFMNPFNDEPLTIHQLKQDALCYLSTNQKQVKSSRFFMGHFHDAYVREMTAFFNKDSESYKQVRADESILNRLQGKPFLFLNGKITGNECSPVDLSVFSSFEEAYHKLIMDLTLTGMKSLQLVMQKNDITKVIYVTGGFARNEIFMRLLATLSGKSVFASDIDNATALGAAMILWNKAFPGNEPVINLGLKKIEPFNITFKI